MIRVTKLTKIYKSRKSGKCVALDHISFTLPDKGFVFVIGKSGSGKTTLLSLLGGLDTITSGEIVEDGKKFSDFGLRDQIYYRNSTVGFIFQDFHLVESLTIYENIMLALQLQGKEDKQRVLKAIKATGLEKFKNRYPAELSGGQKQRVAIARALVKNPKILLADEPTGNLDSKTTVQILNILKALSKKKLVVIVSHNPTDAQTYADEILELSDGKIVSRKKRNEGFDPNLRVEGDTLVIPYGSNFTEENLRKTEQDLKRKHIYKLRQDRDRFRAYDDKPEKPMRRGTKPPKKHLKLRYTAKLAFKFARHGWFRIAAYSVILAALMVILGLSQLIMNFNGGEVVANEMKKLDLTCNSFIKDMNDGYASVDTTRLVDVEEDDLKKFRNAGYRGEAYPLVNYSLYATTNDISYNHKRLTSRANPYGVPGTFGVLVTEESFLEKKFGPIEYAARAADPKEYGVYITDFFADVCLINHPDKVTSYESLLGSFSKFSSQTQRYGYVNGVIKTGYKERYHDLIEKLTGPSLPKDELAALSKSEECVAFYDEIYQYLDVAFSYNPDFVEDAILSGSRTVVGKARSEFGYMGKTVEFNHSFYTKASKNAALGDNELLMSYSVYNELFGTRYTPQNMNEFVPHEVDFTYYAMCDEAKSQKKYETKLTIAGLYNKTSSYCDLSENVFQELQRLEMFTFGYTFENTGHSDILFNVADRNGFLPNSSIAGAITTMTKAVNVFSEFFNLIFIVLCGTLLLLMIQFEVKSIRDRMRDIGIMKALGSRDIDLILIFGFQIAVAGLLMTGLYIAGSFVFIELANHVLVLSLSQLAKNTMVMDLSFLMVKWKYILQNCLLALLILAVSFIVPMLRLRRIKPTNVIKAKE